MCCGRLQCQGTRRCCPSAFLDHTRLWKLFMFLFDTNLEVNLGYTCPARPSLDHYTTRNVCCHQCLISATMIRCTSSSTKQEDRCILAQSGAGELHSGLIICVSTIHEEDGHYNTRKHEKSCGNVNRTPSTHASTICCSLANLTGDGNNAQGR